MSPEQWPLPPRTEPQSASAPTLVARPDDQPMTESPTDRSREVPGRKSRRRARIEEGRRTRLLPGGAQPNVAGSAFRFHARRTLANYGAQFVLLALDDSQRNTGLDFA